MVVRFDDGARTDLEVHPLHIRPDACDDDAVVRALRRRARLIARRGRAAPVVVATPVIVATVVMASIVVATVVTPIVLVTSWRVVAAAVVALWSSIATIARRIIKTAARG